MFWGREPTWNYGGGVGISGGIYPRQVFYSILVDRFANGDITNDNSNLTMVVGMTLEKMRFVPP